MDILHLPSTPSTMDEARRLATSGAGAPAVVRADEQTAGRGRSTPWASPRGGLWFTLLLRPTSPPTRWPLLPLAAGVAVAEALEAESLETGLKWPNDVLTPEGLKLAGVLLEARAPDWVLVGVGVNVGFAREALPVEVRHVATAVPVDREAVDRVFDAAVKRLVEWAEALDDGRTQEVVEAWRARTVTLGHDVEVGGVTGRAVDVEEDGTLVVETENGVERVRSPAA